MRFRLKQGRGKHHYIDGDALVTVHPGDVIDVPKDMLATVIDKFEQLDDDPRPVTIGLAWEAVPRSDGKGWDVLDSYAGAQCPVNDMPVTEHVAREVCGGQSVGKFWTIPHIWNEATVFILGGGPSLGRVDLSRLHGQRVIAVNNAYQLGPWPVMFYGDHRWFLLHSERLAQFPGLKITTSTQQQGELGRSIGIRVVDKAKGPFGIQKTPKVVSWNKSSGACAINVAVHLGAKKIVLFGFDMRKIDGCTNWHADHPHTPNVDPYFGFLAPFELMARDLKAMGIECVNATPGSALTVFPIVDPEAVLP